MAISALADHKTHRTLFDCILVFTLYPYTCIILKVFPLTNVQQTENFHWHPIIEMFYFKCQISSVRFIFLHTRLIKLHIKQKSFSSSLYFTVYTCTVYTTFYSNIHEPAPKMPTLDLLAEFLWQFKNSYTSARRKREVYHGYP